MIKKIAPFILATLAGCASTGTGTPVADLPKTTTGYPEITYPIAQAAEVKRNLMLAMTKHGYTVKNETSSSLTMEKQITDFQELFGWHAQGVGKNCSIFKTVSFTTMDMGNDTLLTNNNFFARVDCPLSGETRHDLTRTDLDSFTYVQNALNDALPKEKGA